MIATLGGAMSALTGHATWQVFAIMPDGKPTVLVALAAVTLTCLAVGLLARGAQLAAAVTAVPLKSGAAALCESISQQNQAKGPAENPGEPGALATGADGQPATIRPSLRSLTLPARQAATA